MEIEYLKSAATLLDRDCVDRRGLDLSKEVLWISLDQKAQLSKLEVKKNSAPRLFDSW